MTRIVDLDGTRIACDTAGNGPPLLLIHGAEGSRQSFARLLPWLTGRFTVITYDQRDCGQTENPEASATLAMLADDAHGLLAALGHPVAHVFGTSFGGRVAQMLAARHPRSVHRLVLASTWPVPVALADVNRESVHELGTLRSQLPGSAERLAEFFYPAAYLDAHPEARAHFRSAAARSARSDRRGVAIADVPALDMTRIVHPTLVIAGDADRVVPPAVTLSLADRLPDSRTVLLPGVGHLSYVQAPELLVPPLLEFLQ